MRVFIYVFTGWSLAGCPGTGSCTVAMSANFEVTASFEEPTQQTLTARISHFVGQNGKAYDTNPVLAAKCPKAKKKGAKSKKGKRPARAGR